VLRWENSRIRAYHEPGYSAGGSDIGLVVQKEKFESLGSVVPVAVKTN